MGKKSRKKPFATESAHEAGKQYVRDQLNSDYFRDWVRQQMLEAERDRQRDPSSVIPLESPSDYRKLARNMLQQLGWDIGRELDPRDVIGREASREEQKEFSDGMHEELRDPNVVHWLTDEVMLAHEEVRKQSRTVSARTQPRPMRRSVHAVRAPMRPVVRSHRVRDYIAVDNRGRTIAGPFADYGKAKHEADRMGGYVQFTSSRRAAAREDPRDHGYDPDSRAGARNFPRLRRVSSRS